MPLIYFADSVCYVINSSDKFKKLYDTELLLSEKMLKYYKTKRIDTITFHMHISTVFDDESKFNYFETHMLRSSTELTSAAIQVNDNEWRTMVVHEMFHGFQQKHPALFKRLKDVAYAGNSQSTLHELYSFHDWYSESIASENEHLLSALNNDLPTESIQKFLNQRNYRYSRVLTELNIDIREIEELFETMEGTARYIEVNIYPEMYDLEKSKWIWDVGDGNYFYATGFNIVRLLEKLEVESSTPWKPL